MTIAHVSTSLFDGGAEAVLYRLCTNDPGNRHVVIALRGPGKYGPCLQRHGIEVHALAMRPNRLSASALGRLVVLLRRVRPDIVQTWMYHGGFVGGIAAKFARTPNVVWGIHHTNLDPVRDKFTTRCVAHIMARLSRTLPLATILCAAKSKTAHVELGFCVEGMRVVRNGYDLEQFTPKNVPTDVKRNLVGDLHVPLVGMVARYHPQKDHDNLLEALRILLSRGQNCHFVLAGTGLDCSNAQVERLITQKGLSGHVTLLGPCNDVPQLMNILDLHVLSSAFGEAFPNVIAEAMACGTPCVTTDIGDAAEIVGDTGWVVPPKDPNALANAIELALSERQSEKWQLRRKAARKRIEENFSIARMIDGYNAVWREVLSATARN